MLKVSRFTVLVVALLAFLIAWDPNNSIMGLVSNAWAGLGSAFGPIVVMSLFWRRTNFAGAVAGIVSGGGAVLIWIICRWYMDRRLDLRPGCIHWWQDLR